MLLYIYGIEYAEARHLAHAMIADVPACRCMMTQPVPWTPLGLAGLAALEVEEEVEDGTRQSTSKLSAVLTEPFPSAGSPLVFRLSLACGQKWVLGSNCKPYPLTVRNASVPSTASEASVETLSVSYSGRPLRIISIS